MKNETNNRRTRNTNQEGEKMIKNIVQLNKVTDPKSMSLLFSTVLAVDKGVPSEIVEVSPTCYDVEFDGKAVRFVTA